MGRIAGMGQQAMGWMKANPLLAAGLAGGGIGLGLGAVGMGMSASNRVEDLQAAGVILPDGSIDPRVLAAIQSQGVNQSVQYRQRGY